MKLEWKKFPSRFRFANSEFGQYRICGRAGIRRKLHIEFCDGSLPDDSIIIHDVTAARQVCQDDYNTRVATIAAANGYVKLEPGQVVVQVEDVKELLHLWISHGPRFAEINRVMRAFAGAVALVECPICRGSGAIRVPHPMKPLVPDYIDNCDNCKGTGFVAAALDANNKE